MKTQLSYFFRPVAALGLLAVALLMAAPGRAQSRNVYDWAWVNRLGATALRGQPGTPVPASFTQPESMAADAAGNVIIAGPYDPDVIFDSPAVRYQTTAGTSGSLRNSYVAKYTPGGALAWTLDLSSNGEVYVRDVAVDAAGNIYVLGRYYQQLRIGSTLVALANTLDPHFLVKLSPTGVLAWATTIEPDMQAPSRFQIQRLAVDAAGNSAVQGEFGGQVTINGTSFGGAGSTLHALVVGYDAFGSATGSFAAYTTGIEQYRSFTGIALTSAGECYLSGSIASGASLQFGTLPTITGPAPVGGLNYSIGFIVKLDAAMTVNWMLTTTGATGTGQGFSDVVAGPQGRCYALGGFGGGAMTLGPQSLSTNRPNSGAWGDIFLARIAPSGAVESLVGGGGTGKVTGLALGPQGEATISTAGGLSWGNVQLPGAAWPNSFLAGLVQLDAAGVPQRGWQAGVAFSTAPALAVDGLNRPVLAGTYGGASPFAFGTVQRTSPYAWNTLIARTATTVLASRQAAQVAGLEVYPNPARHVVEVHTAQAGAIHLQLLDVLGRTVRAQTLSAGQTRLDLTGLAAGSYTLRVQQGEARSYQQLTVEP